MQGAARTKELHKSLRDKEVSREQREALRQELTATQQRLLQDAKRVSSLRASLGGK